MAQARVKLPEDTSKRFTLQGYGFRWCRKHKRWEKTLRQNSPQENARINRIFGEGNVEISKD